MPIKNGIVEEVDVEAVLAGAVEIARERGEGAFEIGRAAGGVVPLVADFFVGGGIEGQRVAVAIKIAAERHAGIDAVVESAFDDVGVGSFAGGGGHAPVPHHVADCGAAFAVGFFVGQFGGGAEGFA